VLFVHFVLMRVGRSTERLATLPANYGFRCSKWHVPRRAQRLAAELIRQTSGVDRREDRRLDRTSANGSNSSCRDTPELFWEPVTQTLAELGRHSSCSWLFECLMHSSRTNVAASRVLLLCRQPWAVGANLVIEALGQCSNVFDLVDRADRFCACKFRR
jgi:hypothetical protein